MKTDQINKEVAIKMTNVKKMYKLGQIGGGTLQADLQSWWAKVRGKEDPNTKIGEERLIGQTFMALNGVNLEVYKGEALGIIGGNGAGKSTMLKLLSKVTAPTDGKIQIWGRIASMLEVGTGFNGEMTGRENVYMNGAILGMTKTEIDAKMEDIIEFSEVRDFIDTPVKRYSSGMYVKLAFSVAAHLDSEILIMDEVLAVGDMAFQKKCLEKMKKAANEEGRTVLYVSHNMNTIRQLCDRCIVLDKGKNIFEGNVEDAISVYMNNTKDVQFEKIYDDYKRPKWLTQKLILHTAKYINKQDNVYIDNEKMNIQFQFESKSHIENLGLRIELSTLDDVPQATYVLYDFCNCEKNRMIDCTISLNIQQLAESEYKTMYTFFQIDDLGTSYDVECVPGLSFNRIVTTSSNSLKWNAKKWGNIILDTPIVTEIEY